MNTKANLSVLGSQPKVAARYVAASVMIPRNVQSSQGKSALSPPPVYKPALSARTAPPPVYSPKPMSLAAQRKPAGAAPPVYAVAAVQRFAAPTRQAPGRGSIIQRMEGSGLGSPPAGVPPAGQGGRRPFIPPLGLTPLRIPPLTGVAPRTEPTSPVPRERARGIDQELAHEFQGVEYLRVRKTSAIDRSVTTLAALDPSRVFETLRNPREDQKDQKFVPQNDYPINSFFVRKPKETGGTAQHWEMYFRVERPEKTERWIKIDLLAKKYRVFYNASTAPKPELSGTDFLYSVNHLTVSELYQLLSTVAQKMGPYRTTPKYNCQDFVNVMLEELKPHGIQAGNELRFRKTTGV